MGMSVFPSHMSKKQQQQKCTLFWSLQALYNTGGSTRMPAKYLHTQNFFLEKEKEKGK